MIIAFMSDNPEDLVYCSVCSKPIYDGDRTFHMRRSGDVMHADCFFKVFKEENVTIETDEHGDAYYRIDVTEDFESEE
jgi:hypothetical protein